MDRKPIIACSVAAKVEGVGPGMYVSLMCGICIQKLWSLSGSPLREVCNSILSLSFPALALKHLSAAAAAHG